MSAELPHPSDAYFQTLEREFILHRGAPLLLSPADYRLARRWYEEGVPLSLVVRAIEEVFARRDRTRRKLVLGLSYCRPRVEAQWAELRELQAPGEREAAPAGLGVSARLTALAAALPASLPGRPETAERIAALKGPAPAVEAALAELDRELLAALVAALPPADRAGLEAEAAAAVAPLADRLPPFEAVAARERLLARLARRRAGLPVLSLFAPEAEPGEKAEEAG